MDTEIAVALIAFLGSAIGTFGGILINTKLSNYRIAQLEKQVEKHNRVVERVYILEKHEEIVEEKIKTANHRIDDLEGYHK